MPHSLEARSSVFAVIAAGAVLCVSLPAQTWQLPERGAAFYKRSRSVSGGAGTGFADPEMPPVLFAGELDRRQKYVALPPADSRDLTMWLAFDLRIGKRKFTREVHTVIGVGNLEISGKGSSMDTEGVQTITATVKAGKPAAAVAMRGGRFGGSSSLSGTIEIKRTFDRQTGLVREFEATFRAKSQGGGGDDGPGRGRGRGGRGRGGMGGGSADFTVRDRWTLDRVERNRQPEFDARVATAIRLGTEHVKSMLTNGMIGQPSVNGKGVDFNTGTLALCLLTLLKADVPADDKAIVRGFKRLRRRNLEDTYSLGVSLMAMEALYAPSNERQLLIEGRIKKPLPRKVSEKDLELMKEWTAKLLKNFDISQQQAYMLRFWYSAGNARYDNSNTQYALLGLYSAYLCQVPISAMVWFANANHWLNEQFEVSKVSLKLTTTSHAQFKKIREAQRAAASAGTSTRRTVSGGSRRTVSGRLTKATGWPYVGQRSAGRGTAPGGGRGGGRGGGVNMTPRLTASMTTAGLTGVTICQAVLGASKKGGKLLGKLEKSKRGGFAWMMHEFSVRINKNNGKHFHYYLYGLERACEINQIALLGNRDWYFEGANILVETQIRSGGGGRGARGPGGRGGVRGRSGPGGFQGAGLPQTCMAILFLKQSAPPMPVITGRR